MLHTCPSHPPPFNRPNNQKQNITHMRATWRFVDWRQCTTVTHRKAVTVIPSSSVGGNVVVAWSSTL
jgi:hypothetical protein